MYQGYMRSAFDIIDSSESAPPSATGDRSPNVKQICPFVTDKEAAFLRRLENLPPDQESPNQILFVDIQQRPDPRDVGLYHSFRKFYRK